MNDTTRTVDALYAVGHRLIALDRHRDALSLFRTMLVVAPQDERGWLALGACHEALDETEKALVLYSLADAACDGKALRCTIARARLHRTLGAPDEAAAAYADAARLAEAIDDEEAFALVEQERGAA
jgi:tetratricopeptide (TPR) repeat protein